MFHNMVRGPFASESDERVKMQMSGPPADLLNHISEAQESVVSLKPPRPSQCTPEEGKSLWLEFAERKDHFGGDLKGAARRPHCLTPPIPLRKACFAVKHRPLPGGSLFSANTSWMGVTN